MIQIGKKITFFAKCQKTVRFLSIIWPKIQIWPKQNEKCYADFRFFTTASVKMPQKKLLLQVISQLLSFFLFCANFFLPETSSDLFSPNIKTLKAPKRLCVLYTKLKFFEENYWFFQLRMHMLKTEHVQTFCLSRNFANICHSPVLKLKSPAEH